jgi:hypothetical protein
MQDPGTLSSYHLSRRRHRAVNLQGSATRPGRSPGHGFPGIRRVAERKVRDLPCEAMSTPQVSCALAQVT